MFLNLHFSAFIHNTPQHTCSLRRVYLYRCIHILTVKKLANFVIGTTNISPEDKTPVLGEYHVCATSNSSMAAGETRPFECVAEGRYVIVQKTNKIALTLCEVEVYGGMLHNVKKQSKQYAFNFQN